MYDLVDNDELDGAVLQRALLVKLHDLEQEEFHEFISVCTEFVFNYLTDSY